MSHVHISFSVLQSPPLHHADEQSPDSSMIILGRSWGHLAAVLRCPVTGSTQLRGVRISVEDFWTKLLKIP